MVSNLAIEAYEKMVEEGLKPTLPDLIYINSLGLRLEKGPDIYNLGSVPRASFLGDNILWEPTLKKRLWIDKMKQLLSDNYITQLNFLAYSLNMTDDDMYEVKDINDLNDKLQKFSEEILVHYTETLILAAIQYALYGNDWRTNEEFKDLVNSEVSSVYDFPEEAYSQANQIYAEAIGQGIDNAVDFTIPTLKKLILLCTIRNGSDVLKDIQAQDTGKFYSAVGQIKNRLRKEKLDKENGKK